MPISLTANELNFKFWQIISMICPKHVKLNTIVDILWTKRRFFMWSSIYYMYVRMFGYIWGFWDGWMFESVGWRDGGVGDEEISRPVVDDIATNDNK